MTSCLVANQKKPLVLKTPAQVTDRATSSSRAGWKGRCAKYTKLEMPYFSVSVSLWRCPVWCRGGSDSEAPAAECDSALLASVAD